MQSQNTRHKRFTNIAFYIVSVWKNSLQNNHNVEKWIYFTNIELIYKAYPSWINPLFTNISHYKGV